MENTQNESRTETKQDDTKQDDESRQSKQDDEEARLEEYKKVIDQKTSLRQSNLNPERPGSYFFSLVVIPSDTLCTNNNSNEVLEDNNSNELLEVFCAIFLLNAGLFLQWSSNIIKLHKF
uniref:Uncharacterized protein n=1 Tax=Arundo donax TaxID=35708 RepID=A0A0A9DIN9_ARUDO